MHLINFKELTGQQLLKIIDDGLRIKQDPERHQEPLEGKSLAMIFQKTSTRTRVSFEVAMTQLGGHGLYIDWRTTNLTIADVYDEAQYLSRNVEGILARLKDSSDLQAMADASHVPVINGCDDKYHPSQIIADLMTMKEKNTDLEGIHLVYIGVHNNVCNSLIEGCTKTGVKITAVTPIFNEASRDDELLEKARKTGLYTTTDDVETVVKDADFVYTDTWVDMEFFSDPEYSEEKERRIKLMMPYQINEELLRGSDAYIMHDMPIHRGYEISKDLVEDPKSIIYQQSENRLYSAEAILLKLLREP